MNDMENSASTEPIINKVTYNEEVPKPKNSSFRFHTIPVLIFTLVIVMLTSGAFFLGQRYGGLKETKLPIVSVSTSPPTAFPTVDPLADWKTYSNKNNFTFKYPPDWVLKEKSTIPGMSSIILESAGKKLTISFSTMDQVTGLECAQTIKEEKITILGKEADKRVYTDLGKGAGGDYCLNNPPDIINIISGLMYSDNKFIYTFFSFNKTDYPVIETTFDQILSTFRFLDEAEISTQPTKSSAVRLNYLLPVDWTTVSDKNNMFEVGYNAGDSTINLEYNDGISVFRKPALQSIFSVSLKDYDGGSRHTFIYKQMGVEPTKGDAPEKYQEREVLYNSRSCLFLENVYYSQYPTVWGMCDAGNNKAFLITSVFSDPQDYLKWVKTIRLL